MSEVYGGINSGFACSGQWVIDEWKQISVLLGDPVKTSEVNTKMEGAVFFPNKEHWGSVRGSRGPNESGSDIFIDEFLESLEFRLREGVHGTNQRHSTFLQIDFKVVQSVQRELVGLSFAENISEVSVLFGNVGEVRRFVRDGSRFARDGWVGEMNTKTLHTW